MQNNIELLNDDQLEMVDGGISWGAIAAGIGIGAVTVIGAVALAATAPVSIPCAAVLGCGAAMSGGCIGGGLAS